MEHTAGFLGLHEARQDKKLSGLPRGFLRVVVEAVGDDIRDTIAGNPRRADAIKLVIGTQGVSVVDDEINISVECDHIVMANGDGRLGDESGFDNDDDDKSGNYSDE
ncbi:hypothetical protein CCP4SC76_3060011 [Gammaproteobacteria bacterium]